MAFAGKAAQRDGWGYQAEHLALTHSALGLAALAVARRRPACAPQAEKPAPAEAWAPPRPSSQPPLGAAEQQAPQEHLSARIRTLTSLSVAANKKIATLETELGSTREELVRRDNENRSLQTSLDMMMSENARLSSSGGDDENVSDGDKSELRRMKDAVEAAEAELERMKAAVEAAEAERDEAHTRLAQAKAAAAAAENERDTLAAALDELHRRRDTETAAFNTYLDVLSSRAAAAEKSLEEAREDFARHGSKNEVLIAENARLSRCVAEGDAAVEAAYAQLEQMRTMLAAATAERDKLAAALADGNASNHNEIDNLKSRLEAMSARAAAAEKMLAEVRRTLLEKLELLQESLRVKVCQVKDLRQSHAKLIEDARILLKSVDARDKALAAANDKIRLLTELVAEPAVAMDGQFRSSRTDLLLASTITF